MAVIIEPDNGNASEIGRQLLDLAEDPRDVQWVSWPVAGFKVPEELAVKLKGVRATPAEAQVESNVETARRRPGRPRKTASADTPVPDTGDTEQEE